MELKRKLTSHDRLMQLKNAFPLSWWDTFIMISALTGATLLCFLIEQLDDRRICVTLLYLFAVVIVSRFTRGYFYGITATILSALGINYFFSKPFFAFDFKGPGYPLAFFFMITITLMISTMTVQIKKSEKKRYELRSEALRGNLLRAISHDLRTPLMTISASADLLKQHPEIDQEQKNEILSDITDEADWMIRMVENLLSITRINAQPSKIQKSMEVADEVISSSVMKFKRRFPDMKINISLPEEIVTVPMDAMLVEQVLNNLMQNVIYHGKTATHIDIRLYYKQNYAVYEVKDDGVGLDPKKLSVLFTGYSTDSKESSDKWRGMGIGLNVCKTIIWAHDGDIIAENVPEGGAVFKFRLPIKEVGK
ncbi:MAG: DUF4118 domain-containing protein [Eubacterium sp.]|nr:DUF4118 domain-containing protein [Eubacterium sp.]